MSQGPAPVNNAQVTVAGGAVSGAIQAIAAHPTDSNIAYIGAVNGGVWKTTNAGTSWTPLTDSLPSQSIGDVVFDRADPTFQTIVVGTGRVSNFAQRGDDQVGLYRSTNGGANWTQITASSVTNKMISAVQANGATLLVASTTDGLWRSADTGAGWAHVSDGAANRLPNNLSVPDLVVDPSNSNIVYAGVVGSGIWRSADGGATWANVTGNLNTAVAGGSIRLAVHNSAGNNVVYAATVSAGAVLNGVWYSTVGGTTWTQMDTPSVHPGAQGVINTAMIADPTNPNIVYISGDRITVSPFTGNVVRGNRASALGSQFTSLVNSGANNTAPHADSRAMIFTSAGELLESDDGGIYKLASPATTTASTLWSSYNGNLQVEEVHDIAWNSLSNTLLIGLQDNGTIQQPTAGAQVWSFFNGGDGGDVAVDAVSLAGSSQAIRYFSSQNLGGFGRQVLNSSNGVVSTTSINTSVVTDPQFVTPLEINTINPQRILIGGVSNLYESSNQGGTITSLGAPGANRNAMVYGGRSGGVPNADLIYVGKNSTVYKRTTSGGAITATTALPAGASVLSDVAIDPDEWNTVFAIDDNQIFRSTNAGVTWTDITFALTSISSTDFRTIEFIPGAAADTLVIGTRSGVFSLRNPTTASSGWVKVGTGLPDLLVFDLEYDASDDVLAAGTLGRGAWTFPAASAVLNASASVAGRRLFYNNTFFDGVSPAAGVSDDAAIATDKQALLPGGTATFANYSSSNFGLNGIMIDVSGLPAGAGPTASDFAFKAGNATDVSTWTSTAGPDSISIRRGAGTGGSDRITLIWSDANGNAVKGKWLQVTVLPNAVTGLATADVFYFGNAPGESGNSPTDTFVDGTDFAGARDHPRNFLNRAPVDYAWDYNRDSFVDGTDIAIARDNNTNFLTALKLITPTGGQELPVSAAPPPEMIVSRPPPSTIDSAPPPPVVMTASISGTVFNDKNRNGRQERGEGGIAGFRVYLDTNGSGTWEPAEASVLTDRVGKWRFKQLPSGSYKVMAVKKTRWTAAGSSSSGFTVQLSEGQNATGKDIGEFSE